MSEKRLKMTFTGWYNGDYVRSCNLRKTASFIEPVPGCDAKVSHGGEQTSIGLIFSAQGTFFRRRRRGKAATETRGRRSAVS